MAGKGIEDLSRDWQAVVRACWEVLPSVICLILHGSRVRGYARPDSDYDVIAIISPPIPDGLERVAGQEITRRADVGKVDLRISTPAGARMSAALDPDLHVALGTGIVIGNLPPGLECPLSKQGADDVLDRTEMDLEEIIEWEDEEDIREAARPILRRLMVLEQVLNRRYDARSIHDAWSRLARLPVPELIARIEKILSRLRGRVNAMAENEGDEILGEILLEQGQANP